MDIDFGVHNLFFGIVGVVGMMGMMGMMGMVGVVGMVGGMGVVEGMGMDVNAIWMELQRGCFASKCYFFYGFSNFL